MHIANVNVEVVVQVFLRGGRRNIRRSVIGEPFEILAIPGKAIG